MTYRDEESELARRRALITERSKIDDEDRLRELDDEVQQIDERRKEALRKRLPIFAQARLASPCPEAWDTMIGLDSVRLCTRCDQEVFDLSTLTLAQAEALLASRAGQRTCARLYVRPDGTMLFADCIVGKRGVQIRRATLASAGVLVAATAMAMAVANAEPETGRCALPSPQPRITAHVPDLPLAEELPPFTQVEGGGYAMGDFAVPEDEAPFAASLGLRGVAPDVEDDHETSDDGS